MSILSINTDLKFIEFILHSIDNANDSKTIGQLRKEFQDKFGTSLPHMLNQNFGILRLIPLLLIHEEMKCEKKDPRISIVRHALAHNQFSISEIGYEFKSQKGMCKMSFQDFVDFIWRIENEFYEKRREQE